jgi:hypothetical protein
VDIGSRTRPTQASNPHPLADTRSRRGRNCRLQRGSLDRI